MLWDLVINDKASLTATVCSTKSGNLARKREKSCLEFPVVSALTFNWGAEGEEEEKQGKMSSNICCQISLHCQLLQHSNIIM